MPTHTREHPLHTPCAPTTLCTARRAQVVRRCPRTPTHPHCTHPHAPHRTLHTQQLGAHRVCVDAHAPTRTPPHSTHSAVGRTRGGRRCPRTHPLRTPGAPTHSAHLAGVDAHTFTPPLHTSCAPLAYTALRSSCYCPLPPGGMSSGGVDPHKRLRRAGQSQCTGSGPRGPTWARASRRWPPGRPPLCGLPRRARAGQPASPHPGFRGGAPGQCGSAPGHAHACDYAEPPPDNQRIQEESGAPAANAFLAALAVAEHRVCAARERGTAGLCRHTRS